MTKLKKQAGFTLIELLVVIGIIAILAAVVIIAINPARQFALARNTQRSANVNALLNAVGQRMAENRGVWSSSCTAATVTLPSTATVIGSGSGNVNLEACLVPTYIAEMVVDPNNGTTASTGYTIYRDSSGRVTVSAPGAELGVSIGLSR